MKSRAKFIIILLVDFLIINFLFLFNYKLNIAEKNIKIIDKKIEIKKEENRKMIGSINELKDKNKMKKKSIDNLKEYVKSLDERINK